MNLPTEENARRPDVVPDVDHQDRQVAHSPKGTCKHNQPTRLAKQRRNRRAALRREAGNNFRHQQQEQNDRNQAEKLREIAQPDVRFEIARPDIRDLRSLRILLSSLLRTHITDEVGSASLLHVQPPPDPLQRARYPRESM